MEQLKCTYCLTKQHHMLVIRNADGTWHVHAPYNDREIMNVMIMQVRKAMDENCTDNQKLKKAKIKEK